MAKIIELAGMPRTGKTTFLQIIGDYINYETEYSARVMPETNRISPFQKKQDREKSQIWSTNLTINQILESHSTKDYDFVVVDRGIYDKIIFNEAMKRTKILRPEIANGMNEHLNNFTNLESYLVLFLAAPEESYNCAKIKPEANCTRNLEFLKILRKCYDEAVPKLEIKNKILYDHNEKTMKTVADDILDYLKNENK
jgi:broad-specificity NMP kinase